MTDRDSDPQSESDDETGVHPGPFGVLPTKRDHASVATVDPETVLDEVTSLDVYTWRAMADDAGYVERLGPAAEDFSEVFDVGGDPDRVAVGDTDGVALAAIQGLVGRVDDQRRRLERQRETIDQQRDDIETLRERLEGLQAEVARLRRGEEGGGPK